MTMPYRMNGPEEIDTAKLLLWPNNPRLKISDFSEVRYTTEQLLQSKNQRNIFRLLSRHEDHDVVTLVRSMCKVGFMREKAPIVMEIEDADRYLVIEGNRRLTAIKTILADQSLRVSAANRESLKKIPCWIFEHTSKQIPLKAAISRMVAEAHIKGQKAHTKLQRAHMLYDAYEGFLSAGRKARFRLDQAALRATADFFDFPVKDLESELSIVRLYKQIVEAYELEDIPKKCSERLSWVHRNQRQFRNHFGYDVKHLCLDEEGLELFYDIFLHPNAAVYNPQRFKKFQEVMRHGEPADIEIIRDEPDALLDVERRIRDKKSDARFLHGLEKVEKSLKTLRVSDFNGTKDETNAINRISELVNGKLRRLSPDSSPVSPRNGTSAGRFRKPADIQEALSLDYSQLTRQVVKLVKSKPNSSCIKEKVPALLLKAWNLRSRGRPRDAFCEYVYDSVDKMIEDGHLDSYRAKNERVRV